MATKLIYIGKVRFLSTPNMKKKIPEEDNFFSEKVSICAVHFSTSKLSNTLCVLHKSFNSIKKSYIWYIRLRIKLLIAFVNK